MKVVYSDMCRY